MMPRVSRPAEPASSRKQGVKAGVAARQGVGVEDLAGVQVGEHDLGGGNQEVVARDVVGVVLELGQLTRAKHGLTLDDDGRPPLLKTTAGVRIEEEVDEARSRRAQRHRER